MKATVVIILLSSYFAPITLLADDKEIATNQLKLINDFSCWKQKKGDQIKCYDWLYTHPEFKDTTHSLRWKKTRKLTPTRKVDQSPLDLSGNEIYASASSTYIDLDRDTNAPNNEINNPEVIPIKKPFPVLKSAIAKNEKNNELKSLDIVSKNKKTFSNPVPNAKAKSQHQKVITVPTTIITDAEEPDAEAPVAKAPVAKAPVAKAPDAKAPVAKAPDAKAPDAKAPDAKAPDAIIIANENTIIELDENDNTIMELDENNNEITSTKTKAKPLSKNYYMKKLDIDLVKDEEKSFESLYYKFKELGCKMDKNLKPYDHPTDYQLKEIKEECFKQYVLGKYKHYNTLKSQYERLNKVYQKDCPFVQEAAEALVGQKSHLYNKILSWKALEKKSTLSNFCNSEKGFRDYLNKSDYFNKCPKLKTTLIENFRNDGIVPNNFEKVNYLTSCKVEEELSNTLSGTIEGATPESEKATTVGDKVMDKKELNAILNSAREPIPNKNDTSDNTMQLQGKNPASKK